MKTLGVLVIVLSLVIACGRDGPREDGGACASALLPGDVVVSEIMADPEGADEGFEWLELYNASGSELELEGAVLRYRRADGSGEKGHVVEGLSIARDGWAVVANTIDDPTILPAWAAYGYGEALSFGNDAGELSILCGQEVVDVALYGEASSGASRGFDGTRTPDAVGNDDLTAWCDARTGFAEDALGSPGAGNDACFGAMPATCIEDGRERATDPPRVGDLVIAEVMPDPELADDAVGEWLEVAVLRDVDLNGLGVGKVGEDPSDVVGSVACVPVSAGAQLLFAASDDPVVNGGLPERDFPLTLTLSNAAGETSVPSVELRWGEVSLDAITWMDSDPGAALNLDPDAYDPSVNDLGESFCEAQRPYGLGDLGTPGAANSHCLAVGECLEGEVPRRVRAPAVGELLVTEVMPQPEAVADADGEWFEIRAEAAFDLNGLELGEDGAVEHTIEAAECLRVAAGEHVVFAHELGKAVNGGLPRVDGTYGFAFGSADAFFVGHGGVVLDEVVWASSEPGAARSLDGNAADNDDDARWCDAITPYGLGDLGTPGAANPRCGALPASVCDDGERMRAVVVPVVDDLVITEVMPDPAMVGDADGEFFEVLATADVDLNGVQIGRTPGEVEVELAVDGRCLSVRPGDRVVFARSDDPMVNGGIDGVVGVFGFSIANGGGTLFVGRGDAVLDQIAWSDSLVGASASVRPGHETAAGNDDAANLCPSSTSYGAGDRGTPGRPNACE